MWAEITYAVSRSGSFLKKFFLIFNWRIMLLYNIVWVSAIQRESAISRHTSPPSWTFFSHPPPYPNPLDCHSRFLPRRAPPPSSPSMVWWLCVKIVKLQYGRRLYPLIPESLCVTLQEHLSGFTCVLFQSMLWLPAHYRSTSARLTNSKASLLMVNM